MKMEDDAVLDYARQVADRFDPEKIILFGSRSRGDAAAHSDVDLLVIMDFQGGPTDQACQIDGAISRTFPLDLLVRRPADVRRRLDLGDFFLRNILETGRVLYERTGPRVDQKG